MGLKQYDALNTTWWLVISIQKCCQVTSLSIERTDYHVLLKALCCLRSLFSNGWGKPSKLHIILKRIYRRLWVISNINKNLPFRDFVSNFVMCTGNQCTCKIIQNVKLVQSGETSTIIWRESVRNSKINKSICKTLSFSWFRDLFYD